MATKSRGTDPCVKDSLFDESYRFDFFQAVRLLERLYQDRQSIGRDANPSHEVVRFRSHLSLNFPPSAIYEIAENRKHDEPIEMTVAFMGLTGLMGVLPRYYTELLLERVRARDRTLLDFLDLFNHRLISFFYRAWEKYNFPVSYERAACKGKADDQISRYLLALIGLGTTGLQGRMDVPDKSLLLYAGIVGQRSRSACALEQCLKGYMKVPVKVEQFIGEWLNLPEDDFSRLGSGKTNNALGITAIAGTRVWDQQARFELRLGPLPFAEFSRLLPSGKAYQSLVQLTSFFVGQTLGFDVRPILKADEVPGCQLVNTSEYAPQLGWSTWLKTREFTHDAEEVVFAGHLN